MSLIFICSIARANSYYFLPFDSTTLKIIFRSLIMARMLIVHHVACRTETNCSLSCRLVMLSNSFFVLFVCLSTRIGTELCDSWMCNPIQYIHLIYLRVTAIIFGVWIRAAEAPASGSGVVNLAVLAPTWCSCLGAEKKCIQPCSEWAIIILSMPFLNGYSLILLCSNRKLF